MLLESPLKCFCFSIPLSGFFFNCSISASVLCLPPWIPHLTLHLWLFSHLLPVPWSSLMGSWRISQSWANSPESLWRCQPVAKMLCWEKPLPLELSHHFLPAPGTLLPQMDLRKIGQAGSAETHWSRVLPWKLEHMAEKPSWGKC